MDRSPMRTTWNGSLSFGLVSIPVGLAPATKPAARQSDVSFRLLHRECATPIKQKRWCPTHDREVDAGRDRQGLGGREGPVRHRRGRRARGDRARTTTRARSRSRGSSRRPRSTRSASTAPTSSSPRPRPAQRRPYVLLLEAMRETGRPRSAGSCAAAARASASCAPKGDALALETLFLAEDVYSQAEIAEAVEETEVKKPELDLARQIIESLAGDFEPDRAGERVPARPARAARGEAARRGDRRAGARAEVAPVIDLMEALKASVAAAKKRAARGAGARTKAGGEERPRERPTRARPPDAASRASAQVSVRPLAAPTASS